MSTTKFSADEPALDRFYADLAEADLQPLWTQHGLLTPEPVPRTLPYRWRAAELKALGERAGALVPVDRGGDRRVLACANPGLGGAPYVSSTLWAAVQYLGPHEVAPAHRHTPAALRFVLEGEGVWTLVDGDPIAMSAGDLVLTPSWTFHEHHNPGDASMMWLDVLDLPVVHALEAVFFEIGPSATADRRTDAVSESERRFGSGPGLRPTLLDGPLPDHSPLLAYRWADTDRGLRSALEVSKTGAAELRYTDPVRGRDVLPTMRCEITRVAEGAATDSSRQTGSRVLTVLHGRGRIEIGDRLFDVEPGDIAVVPSWSPWRIHADRELDVFTTSDAPVLEALGLFRRSS
ncbi:cupin domain-containing protein [Pseudonocardia broussonetiae]|uniref:Cupin domain-containing protein n=1 Tax=Pseudonocardia broussonetiae TaxID=2736640 RepID=A0A6M6JNV0_9PSEU|nr:cupin domain-containing protein [Pseudonocardia broussonetiae]QJY48119.1 cupin domain-containing protein [Pseudonocardia broussonetiae]